VRRDRQAQEDIRKLTKLDRSTAMVGKCFGVQWIQTSKAGFGFGSLKCRSLLHTCAADWDALGLEVGNGDEDIGMPVSIHYFRQPRSLCTNVLRDSRLKPELILVNLDLLVEVADG
jgi:hypothetical protein